jgi:hypothetical protein
MSPPMFFTCWVLRLDRNKTIGNQAAEIERNLRSGFVIDRNRPR